MKRYLFLPPFFVVHFLGGAADPMFHGYRSSTLERVLDKSSGEVHQIVDTLNKKAGSDPYEERYAVFEGEPGTGKSTLAIAIAYATKRKPEVRSAADFLGGSRNAGCALLKEVFTSLKSSHGKKVLIIEEVNRLLQNYDSEHHDTDSTSMCLWTQLDDLKRSDKRKKIFFIGTMNGVGGLPPQIQSRWEDVILHIQPLHDPDINFNDIMRGLMRGNPEMSSEISDYFSAHKEEFKALSARQVEKLVSKIRAKAYKRDEPFVITMEHVNDAQAEISALRQRMAAETQESDRDQRERHHQESLSQNAAHHEESMTFQKKTFAAGIFATGLVISNVALPIAGPIIFGTCFGAGWYKAGKDKEAARQAQQGGTTGE